MRPATDTGLPLHQPYTPDVATLSETAQFLRCPEAGFKAGKRLRQVVLHFLSAACRICLCLQVCTEAGKANLHLSRTNLWATDGKQCNLTKTPVAQLCRKHAQEAREGTHIMHDALPESNCEHVPIFCGGPAQMPHWRLAF